jgi:hypothetical protein
VARLTTLILDTLSITLVLMIQDGKWSGIVSLIDRADYDMGLEYEQLKLKLKEIIRQDNSSKKLMKLAVTELSKSESLAQENPSNQFIISKFLRQRFIDSPLGSIKEADLTLEVVGAAIERAGKIVDARKFYSSALGLSEEIISKSTKAHLARRFIRTLEKYAAYLDSKGQTDHSNKVKQNIRKHRENTKLGAQIIPDYPVISDEIAKNLQRERDMVEKNNLPSQNEQRIGPFLCTLLQNGERFRIEHLKRAESASLSISNKELRGEVDITLINIPDYEAAWKITDWDLTIYLYRDGSKFSTTVEYGSESITISHQ